MDYDQRQWQIKEKKAAILRILHVLIFLDMTGWAFCMPLLPFLLPNAFVNGCMIASSSLAQATGSLLWLKMTDHFGRRPMLLLSLTGSTIAFLGLAFAVVAFEGNAQIVAILIVRAFGGFSGSAACVGQTIIADVAFPQDRASQQAFVGGLVGIGFMVGPAMSAVIARSHGPSIAFLVAGAIGVVNIVYAILKLPETLNFEKNPGGLIAHTSNGSTGRQNGSSASASGSEENDIPRSSSELDLLPPTERKIAIRNLRWALRLSCFLIFLKYVCFALVDVTFAYILRDYLDWGSDAYACMMVVLGMTMSLTQILLCNRFIALFGEVGTVIIGLLVRSLAFFAGSFSQVMSNPYGCIIGTCSIGVGGALMNPCITALITKSADELANVTGEGKAAYGKHLGRKESAGHCAKLLAPLIGGVGYDSLGLGVNCVGSVISFVTTLGALALVVLLPPHVRNMEQVPDASGVRSRAETDLAGSFMGLEASNAALGLSGRRHGDNNTPPGGLSRKSSYDSEGRDRFPSRDSLGGVPGYQRSMNAPRMLERILSEGAVSEMVPIEHDNPLPRNDR